MEYSTYSKILGATHVLNPDAFIVRTNIALMHQGREFDAHYNSRLSDDALPYLMAAFDDLSETSQETVVRQFANRHRESKCEGDLRSWNLSRWQTRRMLTANQDLVREMEAINVMKPNLYYGDGHNRDGDEVRCGK